MEEESMRTVGEVPWLGSVFSVSFSAVTLLAGRQKEHPITKNSCHLSPKGSLPDQVEDEIHFKTD